MQYLQKPRDKFAWVLYDVPFVSRYIFLKFARRFRETSQFWDIEMFCFREIMLPLKYVISTIAVSEDLNLLFSGVEIFHFWEIAILQFSGD